jgi:ribosomal protein S18 acetylase RimI-like enzyme
MSSFVIKKIDLSDLVQLQYIGRLTFYETFAAFNTEENMLKYLGESFSDERLNNELTNPNSEFYFAYDKNEIIGYLKINFGQSPSELKVDNALEIERIYVLKNYQGKKVGQLFHDMAVDIARKKQLKYVWLGVWEENTKAINFYKKNGFIEFDKHIFYLGNDKQTDIMMKIEVDNQIEQ